jgi:6-pyruvoyltetrahydropterin/6-carboxytetrahydropterin synthase
MKVKLSKDFRFEASHRLDHLPKEHPCHKLHGHGYRVAVEVYGDVDPVTGFLIDYAELKRIVGPIIATLDHSHLNDIEGLEYTSAEHIAAWLWKKVKPQLPILSKITIFETASTHCEYTGE